MINLKIERIKKGLTQKELAEQLGTSAMRVSIWERGKEYPSIKYVQKICNFFNISIDELMGN